MTSKFVVIKKYSDGETLKHFVVYVNANYNEALKKIQKEMKKRKIRNVGKFLICEMLKDFMYIERFYKIPENKELWWLDGQPVSTFSFKELQIIYREFEKWLKTNKESDNNE